MKLFRFGKQRKPPAPPKQPPQPPMVLSASRSTSPHAFGGLQHYIPLSGPEQPLFIAMREAIPMIDAAILKTVRLVGGFQVTTPSRSTSQTLQTFLQTVNVSGMSAGLPAFLDAYLDSLLTFGNAVGEMMIDYDTGQFIGLYHADLAPLQITPTKNHLDVDFFVDNGSGTLHKVANKERILFTALNPKPGEKVGVSLLRSLPFVTSILLQIYTAMGQNFERVGNIRYAVTYKPSGDIVDRSYAKERAELIAREWSEGMRAAKHGEVRDFITVGDVGIKVIGADNQILDTEIPVRQLLEQIIAKMGIPPFLLGLSWSTTERMSQQQTDLLTTELEFYRRVLTPVIHKICSTFLRLQGIDEPLTITWDHISLKDEVDLARSRLFHAQAEKLERELLSRERSDLV